MAVFEGFAEYYDRLYRQKDYAEEASYVSSLIKPFAPQARTVLDLGCGTGRHAAALLRHGFELHGVDRSPNMLDLARKRLGESCQLTVADVTTLNLGRRFDAIISLFHVFSYLTNDQELAQAFERVAAHLNPKGVFVFDFWYGPAIEQFPPQPRILRMTDKEFELRRLSESTHRSEEHIVEVDYELIVIDTATRRAEILREVHDIRYLFLEELEHFLDQAGLELKVARQWMHLERGPSPNHRDAVIVACPS